MRNVARVTGEASYASRTCSSACSQAPSASSRTASSIVSGHRTRMQFPMIPAFRYSCPKTMKACGGRYVQYFNRKYSRSGTLWNGRYKPILVDDERGWLRCLRYIERNPVEAGIVRDPSEYEWSSYRTHALGEASTWLTPHPVYLALGSTPELRQAVYRAIASGVEPDPTE